MKINRMAEEKKAPEWIFDQSASTGDTDNFKYLLNDDDIYRIMSLPKHGDLNEQQIIAEREVIEKCASAKKYYYYNIKWGDNTINTLKEYAIICGLKTNNLRPVDYSYVEEIHKLSEKSNDMIKTASTSKNNLVIDAFKIDEKANMDHMKKNDWQKVSLQSKMADKPSYLSNAVKPLRGGEDYNKNPMPKIAKGQNSITNPNAIENYLKDPTEDLGDKLRKENEAKIKQKKNRHEEWEKEKIAAMEHLEIIPKGKVFVTECMNAQPGIKGEVFDFSKIPDKSEGEKIKDINLERKEKIQRKSKEKYQFQVQRQNSATISDDFVKELKKHLNKSKE